MGLLGKLCSVLLLSLLVADVTSISCASNCSCVTGTFSCQVCLEYYYQVYSLEKKECQCLPDFTSSPAIVDYCHPFNCQLANDWGCATCHAHATLYFQDSYQYYNCTCEPGYYLNLTDYLCYCLSVSHPNSYYQDIALDQCMACPNQCICDVTGCIQCDTSAMRTVVSNTYSSTCYCKKPNIEINGSCQCAFGCTCSSNGTIDCGPSSNRHLQVGEWVCNHPYVSNNSVCSCQEPYTIINTLGYDECVCKSKTNYSMYYQANGTCYLCGLNCTCDFTGCVSCADFSAYPNYEACTCNQNYMFVYPNCLCLEPYQRYHDPVNNTFSCRCLSYRLSQQYYSNPKGDFCDICPLGCSCDSTGCHGCSDPIRVYQVDSGFSICQCGENSVEIIGKCKCLNLFQFDSSTSTCRCKIDPLVIYFDSDQGNCILCPTGCACNKTGCYSCINSARRAIVIDSQGISTCYCADSFAEVDGLCVCPKGYLLVSDRCQCSTPYYLNNNNGCSCMSDLDPSLYYYDDFEDECKVCPQGCLCNERGCTDCGSDFFRTIKYSFQTLRYRCPCLQNVLLVGGYCTLCRSNSYPEYLGNPINITCISCTQCQTCNRFGCVTCPSSMKLVNNSCVCNNQTLINKDGVCICPGNQYLSQGNCLTCPLQCSTCIELNSSVTCTSCDLDGNRQDLPFQGCPCLQGFMESPVPSTYCCNHNCETCDQNGCLTCPPFTHRALLNNSCGCEGAFTQDTNGICVCASGSYLLKQDCFKCPAQCKACVFDTTSQMVVCTECNSGTNRDNRTSNCACLNYYSETRPINSPFCYATHCVQTVIQCPQCEAPWKIDPAQGYCVCQEGYWVDESDNPKCLNCTIRGCLDCLNQFLCKQCDQAQHYYLVNSTCIGVNQIQYIEAQTNVDNIILQSPIIQKPYLLSVAAEALPIRSKYQVALEPSVKLEVLMAQVDLNGTLITLKFRNIPKPLYNVIISLTVQTSTKPRDGPDNPSPDFGLFNASSTYNLKIDAIYSDDTFERLNQPARVGLYVFVLLAVLTGLGFYVWGYKHNQICFFMQTMSLSGFTTAGQNMEAFMFLYNMRFSYYNFSPTNALSARVPSNYIETSTGNYRFLNIDANIFRNIGIPLILAICTALVALILRVFHLLTKNKPLVKPAGLATLYKKIVYRVIEFFYKTLMYPLVYFCIQTLFDWRTRKVYIEEQFKHNCNILSIVILTLYFLVTCYQFFWEVTSKFNRIENLKQFVNNVLASVIIVNSVDQPNIRLLLMVIFVFHQLLYVRFKSERLVGYVVINIMRAVIVSCQLVCVILLTKIFVAPLIVMVCLTVLLKMGLLVYKLTVDRHYDMISKLTSLPFSEAQDGFSFRDLQQNST